MMKALHIPLLAATFILAAPAGALAQSGHDHHGSHGASRAAAPPAASDHSEGTVRKVDKTAGKITIAHGPLPRLDMPPMTMAFAVADAAMLEQVKTGDSIRFIADKVGSTFTVVELERLP
ncbi:RND transporter [Thauera propionica]|uniref:RND transporter n=1 Tax=Thauera propionica TaxID=2019431 RepID=A0A235EX96_9RHOO|nr:copper-binding protein [Thauera propionica]OYD53611.1 RND transporter [Thauera propionica]